TQSNAELAFVKSFAPQADGARHSGKPVQASNRAVRIQDPVGDVVARVGEMRCVAEVERFRAELQFEPLRQVELPDWKPCQSRPEASSAKAVAKFGMLGGPSASCLVANVYRFRTD